MLHVKLICGPCCRRGQDEPGPCFGLLSAHFGPGRFIIIFHVFVKQQATTFPTILAAVLQRLNFLLYCLFKNVTDAHV